MLAVRLGGDTGAVSNQQSHCAGAGDGDGHAGGSHRRRAGRVGVGLALLGVGAHVTLQLGGRLALDATQLAKQHPSGPCPAEAAAGPPALLPLLSVVLLGVDPQVCERGEACNTEDTGEGGTEDPTPREMMQLLIKRSRYQRNI